MNKLFLLPCPLSDEDGALLSLPASVAETIQGLTKFIVENERTARRFIAKVTEGKDIRACELVVYDKRTKRKDLQSFLSAVPEGEDIGLLSEAGCPGIADPGALAVQVAHQLGWDVIPITGPSSILLALMGSGFSGQQFAFHGYLPIEKEERIKKIRHLENDSSRYGQSQIFMETPYRNDAMVDAVVNSCHDSTKFCIATDLTASTQEITTRTIAEWKKEIPSIRKRPSVFILYAGK